MPSLFGWLRGVDRPLAAATFLGAAVLGVPLAGVVVRWRAGQPPTGPVGVVLAEVRELLDQRGLDDVEAHRDRIRTAAEEAQVDPLLLGAIMFAESRGRSGQASSAGALGLMQLVPAAARDAARRAKIDVPEGDEALTERLLGDDDLNVRLGAAHLAWLLHHRGDWTLEAVLVSYNAGRTKLFRWIDRHGTYGAWARSEEDRAAAGKRTTGALAYARQVLRARDELERRRKL